MILCIDELLSLFFFLNCTLVFLLFSSIIYLPIHLLDWLHQATPNSVSDAAGGHGDQIDF